MNATAEPRTLPLVAVLYDVPLFAESLAGVFEGLAEVRAFTLDDGAPGLLRSLKPAALIVEAGDGVGAAAYACSAGIPVVRVDLRRGTADRGEGAAFEASPVEIRNAIAHVLIGGAA